MTEFYTKQWGFEPGNASAGAEIGVKELSGVTNWSQCNKWKWVADLVSFSVRIVDYEVMLRFYHPHDWRAWVLKLHPTRG